MYVNGSETEKMNGSETESKRFVVWLVGVAMFFLKVIGFLSEDFFSIVRSFRIPKILIQQEDNDGKKQKRSGNREDCEHPSWFLSL